jgi:hypothetical protein
MMAQALSISMEELDRLIRGEPLDNTVQEQTDQESEEPPTIQVLGSGRVMVAGKPAFLKMILLPNSDPAVYLPGLVISAEDEHTQNEEENEEWTDFETKVYPSGEGLFEVVVTKGPQRQRRRFAGAAMRGYIQRSGLKGTVELVETRHTEQRSTFVYWHHLIVPLATPRPRADGSL